MPHACPDVLRSPSAGKTRILPVCLSVSLIDRPDIHCPPPHCPILTSDWSSSLSIVQSPAVTEWLEFCPLITFLLWTLITDLQTELLHFLSFFLSILSSIFLSCIPFPFVFSSLLSVWFPPSIVSFFIYLFIFSLTVPAVSIFLFFLLLYPQVYLPSFNLFHKFLICLDLVWSLVSLSNFSLLFLLFSLCSSPSQHAALTWVWWTYRVESVWIERNLTSIHSDSVVQ